MTSQNGSSASDLEDNKRDEDLAIVEIAVLSVIFVITILGNSIVLLSLSLRRYKHHKKITRMYYFIVHLSISDLITALFEVLPQLAWDITYRFVGGPYLCKIIKYLQPLGLYLSSYILVTTAIDRYRAICYPLTYNSWRSKYTKKMVLGAWILSIVFCLPQLLIFSYKEVKPGIMDCWATFTYPEAQSAYVTWYSISFFLIPLCLLCFTFGRIILFIWQPSHLSPLISRAKVNTVKQTVIIISLYIICSTPFIGALLWVTWDPHAQESAFFTGPYFTIMSLLSSLNSCVNPWIYLCFNKELLQYLCFWRCDKGNRFNYELRDSSSSRDRSSGKDFLSDSSYCSRHPEEHKRIITNIYDCN